MDKKQFHKAIDKHNAWVQWYFQQQVKEVENYNKNKPFWKPKKRIDGLMSAMFLTYARRNKSPENFILWKKGMLKLHKIPE